MANRKKYKPVKIFDTISVGNRNIDFQIIFSTRKTFSLEVHPDCTVVARVPFRTHIFAVRDAIRKGAEWISTKIDEYKPTANRYREKKYIQGEEFKYLGSSVFLNIERDLVNKVSLSKKSLNVKLTTNDKSRVKDLVDSWYRDNAERIIRQRFEHCRKLAYQKLRINCEYIPKIRKFKKRWGSCSSEGKILLSYDLVKYPRTAIDYVIMHELCHIKEFNHSPAFYTLLDKAMPNWRKAKSMLDGC